MLVPTVIVDTEENETAVELRKDADEEDPTTALLRILVWLVNVDAVSVAAEMMVVLDTVESTPTQYEYPETHCKLKTEILISVNSLVSVDMA